MNTDTQQQRCTIMVRGSRQEKDRQIQDLREAIASNGWQEVEFIEDAVESLMQSNDSFILFVIRDKKTLAETFLNDDDKAMLREWVDTGHWNRLIESRLK